MLTCFTAFHILQSCWWLHLAAFLKLTEPGRASCIPLVRLLTCAVFYWADVSRRVSSKITKIVRTKTSSDSSESASRIVRKIVKSVDTNKGQLFFRCHLEFVTGVCISLQNVLCSSRKLSYSIDVNITIVSCRAYGDEHISHIWRRRLCQLRFGYHIWLERKKVPEAPLSARTLGNCIISDIVPNDVIARQFALSIYVLQERVNSRSQLTMRFLRSPLTVSKQTCYLVDGNQFDSSIYLPTHKLLLWKPGILQRWICVKLGYLGCRLSNTKIIEWNRLVTTDDLLSDDFKFE